MGQFSVTFNSPVSGPAMLSVRAGIWNSSGRVEVDLAFTFNGTALSPTIPLVAGNAYFAEPMDVSFDVGALVTSGLNTLSVFGTPISGSPTYTIGELTLDFTRPTDFTGSTAIPLPATAWLMMAGLGALVARKRMG